MGYPTARQNFEQAKSASDSEAIVKLADGLIALSRAIETDLAKIERAVKQR